MKFIQCAVLLQPELYTFYFKMNSNTWVKRWPAENVCFVPVSPLYWNFTGFACGPQIPYDSPCTPSSSRQPGYPTECREQSGATPRLLGTAVPTLCCCWRLVSWSPRRTHLHVEISLSPDRKLCVFEDLPLWSSATCWTPTLSPPSGSQRGSPFHSRRPSTAQPIHSLLFL